MLRLDYIMHSLLDLFALIVSSFALSDATPLVIPWNTAHSYGPDGPWPVVTVQVGSSDAAGTQPLSTVDLYPGGIWESMILRHAFCNPNGTTASNGSTPCLAEKAGLYHLAASRTVQQNFTDEVGLIWQWGSNNAANSGGIAENVLDTMTVPSLQGAFAVPNSTISAVTAWLIELPDGTYYSVEVGTLSLGAPSTVQVFSPTVSGQTVPGYAYTQGSVASNSWGLHYGSASLNQEGSLVFGGYDQSRVLGDVGAFDLAPGAAMIPNLLDIQIGVETGSSPFTKDAYTGLLQQNASFNGVQPAVINPIVPYLFASPETCAAIAENLPVALNSQVGLYIWNTTDPQYERIIKSPAYLAFVFQNAGGGNFTIKVAFRLLNLTLEAPIVATPQQYFPCRPFHATDNSGKYFLGKAFLQAAFIGMNWQEETFFLAQAPGPGVGASKIQVIGAGDTTIGADPIENFAITWAKDWTALSDTEKGGNGKTISTAATKGSSPTFDTGNSKTTTAIPTAATKGPKGTSSKTKAGTAAGISMGALAIAGVVLLYYIRKHKTAILPQEKDGCPKKNILVYEKDGRVRAYEVGEGLSHEADGDHQIHELDVRRILE